MRSTVKSILGVMFGILLGYVAILSATSWTTPKSWGAEEVVTATMLNTHIRDNMLYLKEQVDTLSGASAPTGQVAFFQLSSCPTGWTELTAARGRYLVGMPGSGTLSASVGTALTDQENRAVGQHNHTATSTVTDPGHTHTGGVSASGDATSSTGSYDLVDGVPTTGSSTTGITVGTTVNNSGSVAGTNAPYIQLLVCKKN